MILTGPAPEFAPVSRGFGQPSFARVYCSFFAASFKKEGCRRGQGQRRRQRHFFRRPPQPLLYPTWMPCQ